MSSMNGGGALYTAQAPVVLLYFDFEFVSRGHMSIRLSHANIYVVNNSKIYQTLKICFTSIKAVVCMDINYSIA